MKTVFNVMLLLVVIVSATAFSSCKEKRGELKKIWYNGSYNRDFNDLNDVHLSVAKKSLSLRGKERSTPPGIWWRSRRMTITR